MRGYYFERVLDGFRDVVGDMGMSLRFNVSENVLVCELYRISENELRRIRCGNVRDSYRWFREEYCMRDVDFNCKESVDLKVNFLVTCLRYKCLCTTGWRGGGG